MATPYIGLWGFWPVSFCDMPQMTAPVVPAAVAAVVAVVFMPLRIAPSECHMRPKLVSTKVLAEGTMLPGTPIFP